MAQGNGTERLLVVHNDFILVGPGDDPARLKGTASAVDALKKLAIALETGRGEFALAIALGIILLLLALVVNVALGLASAGTAARL
jgi:hypothetical protein